MVRYRTVAGILLFVCAVVGPFWVPFYIDYLLPPIPDDIDRANVIVRVMPSVILIIFACLMSTAGSILAFLSRSWKRTTFVAFFSFLTLGPFFLGTVLGSIAFLMLAMSRDEFDEERAMYGPDILRSSTTRTPPTGPG